MRRPPRVSHYLISKLLSHADFEQISKRIAMGSRSRTSSAGVGRVKTPGRIRTPRPELTMINPPYGSQTARPRPGLESRPIFRACSSIVDAGDPSGAICSQKWKS